MSALAAGFATAHEDGAAGGEAAKEIEEVIVIGVRQRLAQAGLLQDKVQKTEVIGSEAILNSRAVSLTEAMQDQPGVVVSNECSMCGYKRIQLNGLKAEHTTILTDDLPSHTIVSGFYAVDAIPTTGVLRIEVARGAGASMTAPEAIGGTVNVITIDPVQNGFTVDLSAGETGFVQAGVLGTLIGNSDATRLVFIGQHDDRDQFDADGNGVSENPRLANTTVAARLTWDATWRDSVSIRLGHARQELFGGPMLGDVTSSVDAAIDSVAFGSAPRLFENDDVRQRFTGHPWETTEWVQSKRREASVNWLRELANDWHAIVAFSQSDHRQDSFYEGFDYTADNRMGYATAQLGRRWNEAHLVSFGVDARHETMASASAAGQAANHDGDPATVYVSDAFRYDVRAFFARDSWTVTDRLTVDAALRFDAIEADFVDPAKPGLEIDRRLLSPRIDMRYRHDDRLASRFSAGRGYRAPLSFFETDHGILDAALGFALDVDQLERSVSLGYALSFEGRALTWTVSLAQTRVDHLAALGETARGVPLLTQLDRKATVNAADLAVGIEVVPGLTVNLLGATFRHNDAFKSAFAVATIEEQANVSVDWDFRGWEAFASWSWVGARNLADYGYAGFNDARLSQAKSSRAPSFGWLDVRGAKTLANRWTIYVGANNLLDATQAADHQSPLFYGPDGAYDVAYIFGLLRGRETYAGLRFVR